MNQLTGQSERQVALWSAICWTAAFLAASMSAKARSRSRFASARAASSIFSPAVAASRRAWTSTSCDFDRRSGQFLFVGLQLQGGFVVIPLRFVDHVGDRSLALIQTGH